MSGSPVDPALLSAYLIVHAQVLKTVDLQLQRSLRQLRDPPTRAQLQEIGEILRASIAGQIGLSLMLAVWLSDRPESPPEE